MSPRKFDRYLVDLEVGNNLKLRRLDDSEFRCFICGVLPIAFKATVPGCFTVGLRSADADDVAHQSGVKRRKSAVSALQKLRAVGILYYDEELDCERVHDFDEHQIAPRSDPTAGRRQALHRNTALRDEVKDRDKDMCRYCGTEIRWNDRRGPQGGTYDHIDPAGPNTAWNLVVACRRCNSAKGNRTPEEAAMPLRPEPGAEPALEPAPEVDRISSESTPKGSRSEEPPNPRRGESVDDDQGGGQVVMFDRRPVPPARLELATRLLGEFNRLAGTRHGALTGRGRPSESLKRILGALADFPDVDEDGWRRALRARFAEPWWGSGPPDTGVVFGPAVVATTVSLAIKAARPDRPAMTAAQLTAAAERAANGGGAS